MRLPNIPTARYALLGCAAVLVVMVSGAVVAAGDLSGDGRASGPAAGFGRLTGGPGPATSPQASPGPGRVGGTPASQTRSSPARAGGTPASAPPGSAPASGAAGASVGIGGAVVGGGSALLNSLTSEIRVQIDSVSALVTVPGGFSFPDRVSISVLYPDGHRITQDYVPATVNRFLYNIPVGDGVRKNENVIVNLLEYATPDAMTSKAFLPITFEPRWNVTVSPLTFRLISDCDSIGSSEPVIVWGDDRGQNTTELDMSAGDVRTIAGFYRNLSGVTVADHIAEDVPGWYEDDVIGFQSVPDDGPGPSILPGTSYTQHFTSDPSIGGPCLGEFLYSVTIDLVTDVFLP